MNVAEWHDIHKAVQFVQLVDHEYQLIEVTQVSIFAVETQSLSVLDISKANPAKLNCFQQNMNSQVLRFPESYNFS